MNKPQLVKNKEQIISNIKTVEKYLCSESSQEDFEEIITYIKRGHNFVYYLTFNGLHFVPSRFIGYQNNSIKQHKKYRKQRLVTGTDTDKSIDKILGEKISDTKLEYEFQKFCKDLNIVPEKRRRKYWNLKKEIIKELDPNETFSEGELKLRQHKLRERNIKARNRCIAIKGYSCQICGFNFKKVYREIGENYIQVHHIEPISSFENIHEINPDTDLIPVCPNCHAMLHRKINGHFISYKELKELIEKK